MQSSNDIECVVKLCDIQWYLVKGGWDEHVVDLGHNVEMALDARD